MSGTYIDSLVCALRDMRPELLVECQGRWEGPLIRAAAQQGLWWRGPARLLVCISPWDAGTMTPEALNAPPAWLHVSVSTPERCPTYDELTEVRRRFFRPTDTVLHVWPPIDEHYSLHPYCLHLWARLDGGREIPDLRGVGGGV